jgi:hypothetical protein
MSLMRNMVALSLALGACTTPPPPVPPTPQPLGIQRSQLLGAWRLDSLAVYPLAPSAEALPDSTRRALETYEATLRSANTQFRTGEMVITSRYDADSTYEHSVAPKDTTQGRYSERGRWTFDPTTQQLGCRSQAGRPCPHDRAVVERADDRQLVLRLELQGRGVGLGEYFRFVRVAR